MVERKSLGFTPPDRTELKRLIAESVAQGISDAELAEQRVSFVYGNAPKDSRITKESARLASNRLRLKPI